MTRMMRLDEAAYDRMLEKRRKATQKPLERPTVDPVPALVLPAPKQGRPTKYRSRAVGGYASTKEARRAAELKLMEKAAEDRVMARHQKPGDIRKLREQVMFLLIPAQMVDGQWVERACKYFGDFVYDEWQESTVQGVPKGWGNWVMICEDCKGFRTPEYVIKRKLMLQVHKIQIRET